MASTGTLTVTTAQIQAQVTTELVNQGPSSLNIQVYQANPTTGANIGTGQTRDWAMRSPCRSPALTSRW